MQHKRVILILLIGLIAIAPATTRDVSSGSTLFVCENDIAFTGTLTDITQLHYNPNNNVLNSIVVSDPKNFQLLAASVRS